MATGPDGRRRVDLSTLPGWARTLLALGTVLVVGAVALWVGRPSGGAVVPVSGVVAGVLAFGFVAWRGRDRR